MAVPGPPAFDIQNRQRRWPVDRGGLSRFLAAVAQEVVPEDPRGATVRVVSDRRMRWMSRQYLGKDRPTDVLAFPAAPLPAPEDAYLGDLVVSADTAARQAEERGLDLDQEFRILLVHGLLHLLGYDHERDAGEMRRLERLLRRRHGLEPGNRL